MHYLKGFCGCLLFVWGRFCCSASANHEGSFFILPNIGPATSWVSKTMLYGPELLVPFLDITTL